MIENGTDVQKRPCGMCNDIIIYTADDVQIAGSTVCKFFGLGHREGIGGEVHVLVRIQIRLQRICKCNRKCLGEQRCVTVIGNIFVDTDLIGSISGSKGKGTIIFVKTVCICDAVCPGQLQFGFGIGTGVFCHNISFLRVGDINNCSICCKSFGAVCLRGKYLWGVIHMGGSFCGRGLVVRGRGLILVLGTSASEQTDTQ